ncbi:MAG: HD domain-containing protein [Bacteroidales bacterium]|nr:HD domain-containing protein [Bacteroidales bacterium]MCF8388432.1 HD domain-containing protein [Bacteroidales bacterium]MCF8396951.1 HD domain-containing protein [Bacteroidales bacterium]
MTETAERIIEKYYPVKSYAYKILHAHSLNVTRLALRIAEHNKHLKPDFDYIKTAGMLHDIGIFKTDAPEIGCYGKYPYIAHTYLGREILEKEGLHEIATICERHIGVGLSIDDILKNKLPLPKRDMLPISTEEKIICYADKFYSKNPEKLHRIKSSEKILKKMQKYGPEKIRAFENMMQEFGHEYIDNQ